MGLTKKDYLKVLQYYKIDVPKDYKTLKQKAQDIIAEKLCRCIKKVDPKDEGRAIGVCTRSVLNKKGLSRGTFKCKKGSKPSITLHKKTRKRRKT